MAFTMEADEPDRDAKVSPVDTFLVCLFELSDIELPASSPLPPGSSEDSQDSTRDPIYDVGVPALKLLSLNPTRCLEYAYELIQGTPFKEVSESVRRLYTDAALRKVHEMAAALIEEREKGTADTGEGNENDEYDSDNDDEDKVEDKTWKVKINGLLDSVVAILDRAFILAGAPLRDELMEAIFSMMLDFVCQKHYLSNTSSPDKHKDKRVKLSPSGLGSSLPAEFPADRFPEPKLKHPMPRLPEMSIDRFQLRLIKSLTPFVITGALDGWPALNEKSWNNPKNLLDCTLDGRRLVPIEIGKTYVDEAWQQKLVTFKEFMEEYMLKQHDQKSLKPEETGYLAQHDLFKQIPGLRNDIQIPDYVHSSPSSTLEPSSSSPKLQNFLDEPILNAWFGPRGTVSPLHTDPYHNILAQVVGYKYVRLYPASSGAALHPRGVQENGVDMSNTSQIDLDEAMGLFPEIAAWDSGSDFGAEEGIEGMRAEFEQRFPGFVGTGYWEAVLGPGDCLYIPERWWHYVRSLSPSFSVSFWFN